MTGKNLRTRRWVLLVGTVALVAAGCGDGEGSNGGKGGKGSSASGITSVKDLDGRIVGAQDGTTEEAYANKETDAAQVRGFPNAPDAFAALRSGAVDAVVIVRPVAVTALEKQGGAFKIVQAIPTDEFAGFAMSPKNPGLRADVNAALAELKDDGTVTGLYKKYFKTKPPKAVLEGKNDLAEPAGESAKPKLVKEGTLTVGTDTPFPPFVMGQPPDITGYDIELMNAVSKKLGLKAKYTDTSYDTIFRDVAAEQFDIVASNSSITAEREKVVDFSDPYYEAQLALVVAAK